MYELDRSAINDLGYNMMVPNNDIGMEIFKNRVTYPGRSVEGYFSDQQQFDIDDVNDQLVAHNISIRKPIYIWAHTKMIVDVSSYKETLQQKCKNKTFYNKILVIPVTRKVIELDEWESNALNILPEVVKIEEAEKMLNGFVKQSPCNSVSDVILHLEKRGIIRFSLSENVEYHTDFINGYYYDYDTKPIPHHQIKRPELNNFKISLTEQCSQYCSYCYYTENKKIKRTNMKENVLYESIEFIKKLSLELENDRVTISWWGGDPVYVEKMLLKGIAYANKIFKATGITLRHSICSSFVDIEKISTVIKCIKDNNVDVTISCDGPIEIHNRHRQLIGQTEFSSYEVMDVARNSLLQGSMLFSEKMSILENKTWTNSSLERIKKQYKIKQRCTIYGRDEIDNYQMLCEYFNQFDQQYRISLATCDNNIEIKKLLEKKINDAIIKSSEKIIDNYPDSLSKIKSIFLNLHTNPLDGVNYSYSRCGYGGGVVIINTRGQIYSCHRFCDISDYCIGNIKSTVSEIIEKCSVLRKKWLCKFEGCKNCDKLPYCSGGGCAHEAYSYYGTVEHNAGCISLDILRNKAIQTYIFNKLYPDMNWEVLNLEDGSYARHCWYY